MAPVHILVLSFAASRLGGLCAQLPGSRLPPVGRALGPQVPSSVRPGTLLPFSPGRPHSFPNPQQCECPANGSGGDRRPS